MEIRFLITCCLLLQFDLGLGTERDAVEILQNYVNRPLAQSLTIQKLPGMTNENYLISESQDQKYVVRIPGFATACFIDREAEVKNSQEAFKAHFNPALLLYSNPQQGIQITKYIDHFDTYKFEDFYHLAVIRQITTLLHAIHDSAMQFKNDVDICKRISLLSKKLIDCSVTLPTEYFAVKDKIDKLALLLRLPVFLKVPTHGDPVPGNFMLLDGKLKLFDWEYAGLNDPAWDLSFIASVMDYPQELEKELVTLYNDVYSEMLHAKLIFFKPFVEFWLGLWGLSQTIAHNNPSEKEFFSYFATARFRKSLKYLCSDSLKKSLEIIQQHILSNFYDHHHQPLFIKIPITKSLTECHPLLDFPIFMDEKGFSFAALICFDHWICPYCGILNFSQSNTCVGLNCPNTTCCE